MVTLPLTFGGFFLVCLSARHHWHRNAKSGPWFQGPPLPAALIAWLHFRGGRFIDRDLDDVVRLALRGLIHESAA